MELKRDDQSGSVSIEDALDVRHKPDTPILLLRSCSEGALGEAVGNEVWREQELYTEAIPTASGIVEAVADPDTDPAVENPLPGYWLRFDLATRSRVHFVILDAAGYTVRILDWGYKSNTSKPAPGFNYLDLYQLAPGRYRNLVRPTGTTSFPLSVCRPDFGSESGDMNGVAIWWDLRDYDNGLVPNATYYAQMYVEGSAVGASIALVTPLP